MYNSYSGLGYLLGILFVIAAIFFLAVYVILPVSLTILFGIGTVGAISGVGVTLRNFQQLLIEAHKAEK